MAELIAELPVSCGDVVPLDYSALAACGGRDVYFFWRPPETAPAVTRAPAKVSLPRRVGHCAPWHSRGQQPERCGVFYVERGIVYFCGGDGGVQRSREVLHLPSRAAADGVEEVKVLFGATLVVRTRREIFCYALDFEGGAETTEPSLIGTVALPFASAAADATATVMIDGFSCSAASTGGVDGGSLLSVVIYSAAKQRVGAVLVAVGLTCVTVQQKTCDSGLLSPHGADAVLRYWSVDWSRREVLFVFSNRGETVSSNNSSSSSSSSDKITTSTLSLDTMKWAAASIELGQLPAASLVDVIYTHTGDLWAVEKFCDGVVKLLKLSAGCVIREVELPCARASDVAETGGKRKKKRDEIFLTTYGSSIFLLIGQNVFEVRSDEGMCRPSAATTLCDWFMLRASCEACDGGLWQKGQRQRRMGELNSDMEKDDINKVVAFVKGKACGPSDMIVRDCRYVLCAQETTGVYRHAVLDAIDSTDGPEGRCSEEHFLRYIAVAQSLHPATILRVLGVRDPSIRLGLAVLLAAKPSLAAGGVRLLEWGTPARLLCRDAGPAGAKRFIAALYDSALTALAAGALGAVGLLCSVADVLMIAALGDDRRAVVSREEAAAEVAIAEAVSVLSSYAQWALSTAPMLGTMTAHIGPVRDGKKETAVRDRVAHVIVTSRSVQIEPLKQLGRAVNVLR